MKKIINYLYDKIFNKKVLVFSFALIAFILFHSSIEVILGKTIVNFLLSKILSTKLNDVLFTLIILSGLIFLARKFRDYTPSIGFLYLLIYLSIIYFYYRFFSHTWIFTSFYWLPSFKYFDILFGLMLIDLCLFIPIESTISHNNKNSLLDDKPIIFSNDDILGFLSYVEVIASKIQVSSFEKSFGIGINGKWGSGKTSFINLLKNQLTDEGLIKIDFNPWNSHTPQAIIKDFFDTVQEKIKPYNSEIAKLLITYSTKLVSLNSNSITQTIQISAAAIVGFESLKNLFDDINQSLKKINKKIIICVDDLDRLDQNEIVEVIRLIRNTANFYNTFFIVAYDRNYILSALKSYNPYNHEQFLEKIFQIEINLPYFKKDILRTTLFTNLKNALPKNYHTELQNTILGAEQVIPLDWNNWLETMRDVTRLSNSVILNSGKLLGEIDLNDFIKIELLRLKYPSVYTLLLNYTNKFLKPKSVSKNQSDYELALVKDISKDDKVLNQNEINLKVFLNENCEKLSIPKDEVDKIIRLLNDLFPTNQYSHYFTKSNLSIIHPGKFNRYFAYSLFEESLSELEFKSAKILSQDEFNLRIHEWLERGLRLEVVYRFIEIKEYQDKEDFEKILKAIFYLANDNVDGNINPYLINYDGKDLFEKLSDYRGLIANDIYKVNGGKSGLKSFIRSLLNQAVYPYVFESNFVRSVNSYLFDENSFPLTRNELEGISIGYLQKYCNQTNKIEDRSFTLFWNCQQTILPAGGNAFTKTEKVPEKAKEVFRNFVLKDFNNYLKRAIDIETFHQQKFSISRNVETVFNSFLDFKHVLFNEDELKWNFIPEFKEFFLAFEKTDFKQYVDFDFKTIPIDFKFQ